MMQWLETTRYFLVNQCKRVCPQMRTALLHVVVAMYCHFYREMGPQVCNCAANVYQFCCLVNAYMHSDASRAVLQLTLQRRIAQALVAEERHLSARYETQI